MQGNVLVWIWLRLICCMNCHWFQWGYLGWLFDGSVCYFSLFRVGFGMLIVNSTRC